MDDLQHYGVKGMKWGVRKAETPRQRDFRVAARRKKVIKFTAGVAVVAGTAAVGVVLAKNGNLPMTRVAGSAASAAGKKAADDILVRNFKTKAAALSQDIAEANASQDAWMRSLGLGHIVNNRVGLD